MTKKRDEARIEASRHWPGKEIRTVIKIDPEEDEKFAAISMRTADYEEALAVEIEGPMLDALMAEIGSVASTFRASTFRAKLKKALDARLKNEIKEASGRVIRKLKHEMRPIY